MKIGLKLVISWIASLTLFTGAGIAALMSPDWMSGVSGLVLRFFLGYCGIIVVAQVISVMDVIRRLREEMPSSSSRDHAGIDSVALAEIQ